MIDPTAQYDFEERERHVGRWSGGVLMLDGAVVGSVVQGAAGGWFAYGCQEEWEDVSLGAHPTARAAQVAVEKWVRDRIAEEDPETNR
jgi:hypothetical protein